jgi:predicted nucleic acid-binding protein
MHNELRRLAVLVKTLPVVDASQDPGDNFLLAMAQAGEAADVLVTGDKHDLLSLEAFQRTRIISARHFSNAAR